MDFRSTWPFWLVFIAVGAGLSILQYRTWLSRRRKTCEGILAPELQAHGLRFVSSRTPPLLDAGPFAAAGLEVEITYSHSRGPTGTGHYRQYRVVRLKDGCGKEHEAWARLTFEFWTLKRVEWKPELRTYAGEVPPGA